MRIAIVAPGYPPDVGGVEAVVSELAEGLASRSHRVEVLAHRRRGPATAPAVTPRAGQSVHVQRFPDWTGSRRFEMAPGMWRELRHRNDFDVVHAHSFHASAAVATSLVIKAPLVFSPHYHGVGHTRAARLLHRVYDPIATTIFRRADTVICVSQAEADLLASHYPSARGKLEIVRNGVDVDGVRSAAPFELDRPVVLSVGRLEEYKQVALATRAFAALPRSDALFVVAGAGPQLDALRELAVELGVQERVRFLGFVPMNELRRWQRTAAVTMCLSRHEAFGLSLLEAIAAGSRVIASEIPAHTEVADDAGDAVRFVSASASPTTVSAELQELLVSGRGHETTVHVPSWADATSQTEAILRKAAGTTASVELGQLNGYVSNGGRT